MGLNPHLINLMSVRDKQRLQPTRAPSVPPSLGDTSFSESLKESLAAAAVREANATQFMKTARVAAADEARQVPQNAKPQTDSRMKVAQMMNPEQLLERFLSEQDLVLARQRIPANRYRTSPDDDTAGESETKANVRPIES